MSNKGPLGPFENYDDINRYWYQVTEKELEEKIEWLKKDLEDPDNLEEETKIYKRDLESLSQELDNLRGFVDDYVRCTERYKFNKKTLKQLQDDWREYNASLYTDWLRVQTIMLGPDVRKDEERLKGIQTESKLEKIKREEIEKRIRGLLDK